MIRNWKPLVVSVPVGAVAGAGHQFLQVKDDQRATDYATANPGKTMSMWSQYTTYTGFVAPALFVAGAILMGDRVSDDIIIGGGAIAGQLAGTKGLHKWYKPNGNPISSAPYTTWSRTGAAREAAARAAAARSAAPRTYDKEFQAAGTTF